MKKIISFGEIMLRLTPASNTLVSESTSFGACYGGTESNVLVALSSFGESTEYLTALPQNELGDAVCKHLRKYGVGIDFVKRSGDVLGMYFLEEGFGNRPNKVIYNRKGSEITKLDENSFDYDKVFDGCSIFHISGISFALSSSVTRLAFRLLEEAKKRGVLVSFDFNYRAKLWSIDEAKEVYKKIIPFADVVFCSQRDLETFLDTTLEDFCKIYTCKYLVVREREIMSDGNHRATVVAVENNGQIRQTESRQAEFSVLERIGSGDAFDAGVLHVLNNKGTLDQAIEFGLGCFVLKHTVRGDVFALGKDAVNCYIACSFKDVSR